ncbi:MAG TPA: FtsW/RodA/SpoVE family cell cycle protein [Catalimonadaceae bacterium]|nr:FtsW/RodA/SpoVE family cell cycle protein [Catalimonadaceae bacterium]
MKQAEELKNWMKANLHGDPIIWGVVIGLSLLSIAAVYSATGILAYRNSESTELYLVKHTLLVIVGLVGMYYAHRIDYRNFAWLSRLGLIVSIILLGLAYFFGPNINDSKRWIVIPFINQQFQPSDLAKLALITNVAAMLAKQQSKITVANWRETLMPILLWSGIVCGIIGLSNVSTAAILLSTVMLLLYFGRVPLKFLGALALVGLLAGGLALTFGSRGATAVARVDRFLDRDSLDYNTQQSFIAIASGGVFGKGPGKSNQKNLLPHPESDFIYAMIIEEYGTLGGLAVLFLYLVLLYRGMLAVSYSSNAFGGLLSAGLSFLLAIQAIINMAVSVGLVPVTGQTLPLVSMGGTSLLFTGLSFGIILSVRRGDVSKSAAFSKNRVPPKGNVLRDVQSA